MSAEKPKDTKPLASNEASDSASDGASPAGYRRLTPQNPGSKAAAPAPVAKPAAAKKPAAEKPMPQPSEPEAPKPDPTRFGDWEVKGRCIDF